MTQTEGRRVDEQQRATSTAGKQGVRAPASIGFNSLTKAWVWLGANEVDGSDGRVDGIRDRDAAALKSHRAVPRRVCRSRWELDEAATDSGGHHVRGTNEERDGSRHRVEGGWDGRRRLGGRVGSQKVVSRVHRTLWVEGPRGKRAEGQKLYNHRKKEYSIVLSMAMRRKRSE